MENKNSRSTTNLNQRLQVVAERRAQIEEAKRERVQRQIEQVSRVAPASVLQNSNQNSSIAFGSSRARNIDLTRPLVNPITHTRPRSEIFPSSFYAAPSVVDAPRPHVYAKDDTNYHQRPQSAALQPTTSTMSQSMSTSFIQPTYRAVRRHDPELVPAKQKYLFREYTPSPSVTPFKKENSMITSMTSTKSFQVSPVYRTPFGGPQNRPKKSFSMNRLDQLAQPRRRVEPKVPTSASFIRTKEPTLTRNSAAEGELSRGVKPAPPPKTLFKSPKPVPNETGSAGGKTTTTLTPTTKPSIAPKPRPVSQVEPLSKVEYVPEPAPAPALEDEKEDSSDKLTEYKRMLAEKRAMYRKQQEEQQSQPPVPVRKAVIVKPQAEVKPAKEEHSASSASSSSSSSDSESDNEEQSTVTKPSSDVPTFEPTEEQSVPEPTPAAAQPELISFAQFESEPVTIKPATSDNLMTTSLTSDLASLSFAGEEDKLSSASSMTASFDASLLSSNSAPTSQRPQSMTLTKEQLDERSALLLQQERAEREKRKNRVQEILKRTTRKDDKKDDGKSGDDSSPPNGSSDSNGCDAEPSEASENGLNGHSKYNGLNGDGGLNSNHHRDMKHFVSENEQSLPPTNGF